MCYERNGGTEGMNLWQQLSLNWLKDILRGNGEPEMHENVVMPLFTTTERTGAPNPRQKSTLTRGLARYGPWGYLMLGMLVCGAALLICGLWGNLNLNFTYFKSILRKISHRMLLSSLQTRTG